MKPLPNASQPPRSSSRFCTTSTPACRRNLNSISSSTTARRHPARRTWLGQLPMFTCAPFRIQPRGSSGQTLVSLHHPPIQPSDPITTVKQLVQRTDAFVQLYNLPLRPLGTATADSIFAKLGAFPKLSPSHRTRELLVRAFARERSNRSSYVFASRIQVFSWSRTQVRSWTSSLVFSLVCSSTQGPRKPACQPSSKQRLRS